VSTGPLHHPGQTPTKPWLGQPSTNTPSPSATSSPLPRYFGGTAPAQQLSPTQLCVPLLTPGRRGNQNPLSSYIKHIIPDSAVRHCRALATRLQGLAATWQRLCFQQRCQHCSHRGSHGHRGALGGALAVPGSSASCEGGPPAPSEGWHGTCQGCP